jgi:hypothetical protein
MEMRNCHGQLCAIVKRLKYPNLLISGCPDAGLPSYPVLSMLDSLDILAEQNENGIGSGNVGTVCLRQESCEAEIGLALRPLAAGAQDRRR